MSQADSKGKRAPIRLHIGGHEKRAGWTIMDTLPGAQVDVIGNCRDLSQFADGSVEEIYASHVYEHLSYMHELVPALQEAFRVLRHGGLMRLAVPDLEALCKLFAKPNQSFEQRNFLMRMIMGGQMDDFDYHKGGLWFEQLELVLKDVGFNNVRRVESFGLFQDTSEKRFEGQAISLNISAYKA
ncbi:MAG: class I SAM-dependent methyltransferase [Phycisphaerales bacterium]